ncbi:MAG: glycosyltransferase [Candidatus Melainabacteria bacterium HGW-Melainabacteria-1]|nr:MAG: glycosyltransferase [Candidatus Melainabacteria bacterium HGW-Melainabacteria-1]
MRITLLTIGSQGDVRPYVALGKALQASGHVVTIGTHREFEALICGQGLRFYPVKGNPREVLSSSGGQQVLQSGGNILRFLAAFKAAAVDAMRGGFDDCLAASQDAEVLIYSFFVMGIGIQIGEKLGIPSLQAYLQPYTPSRMMPNFMLPAFSLGPWLNQLSHQAAQQLFWQTFRDVVEEWRRKSLKLPPLPLLGPFRELHSARYPVFNGFSRHLVPPPSDWPAWVHTTGFWFLDEADWQPPAELTQFLDAGPAPVYIGFGSMNAEDPEAVTQLVLGALADTGQRGVLMTGWGGLGQADLPDSVHLLEQAPHDWLFPRMAALVHHGGAGTTAAGLRAGVPTVCVPHFGDQPFWGQRVMMAGAGPRPIPRPRLSRPGLADAITQAVTSPYLRAQAAELGTKIRAEDGLGQAVSLFNRLYGT